MINRPIRIALVGVGKIARDQHIPAIDASHEFELACLVSQSVIEDRVPVFQSISEALGAGIGIDAAVVCTPPNVRTETARTALEANLHLMLEKPPAATVQDAQAIISFAADRPGTLLFSWHSRFAPMVERARLWVSERKIVSGRIDWHENVAKWHPGQSWLWKPGGFGVFDPGINALSILSQIHPEDISVIEANYAVPANAHTPIAVNMGLKAGDALIGVSLDFRKVESETWTILLEDESGHRMELREGGAVLQFGDQLPEREAPREYESLYAHFYRCICDGVSDADIAPLKAVEDADAIAKRKTVGAVFN